MTRRRQSTQGWLAAVPPHGPAREPGMTCKKPKEREGSGRYGYPPNGSPRAPAEAGPPMRENIIVAATAHSMNGFG